MSNLKLKNRVRADDLVKTPVSHDMSAFNVEYPDLCGTTRMWVQR